MIDLVKDIEDEGRAQEWHTMQAVRIHRQNLSVLTLDFFLKKNTYSGEHLLQRA